MTGIGAGSDGLLTEASMLEQELNEKCAHDLPNVQLRLTSRKISSPSEEPFSDTPIS